jgi:hypothetical protein
MSFITSRGCLLCIWEIRLQYVSVQRNYFQVISLSKLLKELLGYEWFVYNGISLLQLFGLYGCCWVMGVCTNVSCIVILWKVDDSIIFPLSNLLILTVVIEVTFGK